MFLTTWSIFPVGSSTRTTGVEWSTTWTWTIWIRLRPTVNWSTASSAATAGVELNFIATPWNCSCVESLVRNRSTTKPRYVIRLQWTSLAFRLGTVLRSWMVPSRIDRRCYGLPAPSAVCWPAAGAPNWTPRRRGRWRIWRCASRPRRAAGVRRRWPCSGRPAASSASCPTPAAAGRSLVTWPSSTAPSTPSSTWWRRWGTASRLRDSPSPVSRPDFLSRMFQLLRVDYCSQVFFLALIVFSWISIRLGCLS